MLHYNSVISRLMAHVCYQPGLSAVYTELFDFSGDEIYIEAFPQLEGLSFHDAQLSFAESTLIGIERGRQCLLNPEPAMILQPEDKVILIASDDGVSIPLDSIPAYNTDIFDVPETNRSTTTGDLLILGTSPLLTAILYELEHYLPEGSRVSVASKYMDIEEMEAITSHLTRVELNFLPLDIGVRNDLNPMLNQNYKHILLLSDRRLSPMEADAKTLSVLLQIREWQQKNNVEFSITTEMMDAGNQELAQVADVNDFVISHNISGLITTQIAENRQLARIISDLLDADGSEIYLKPAANYFMTGQLLDFFEATHLVSQRDEVLIGYKKTKTSDKGRSEPVIVINPDKSQKIAFAEDDWIIVLAED